MERIDNYLIEVAQKDQKWSHDAEWAVAGNWDMNVIAEEEAWRLQQEVIKGEISLKELRLGVVWANALDREAVEVYGSDLKQGEQAVERFARRHMHLAGRLALTRLRNARLRTAHIAHQSTMSGMGGLGSHDIRDRNLVQ